VARIGNAREFGVQYWQPLGAGSPWYAAPSIEFGSTTGDVFDQGRRVARLGYSSRGATLALGRQFGNWGDLKIGVTRQKSSAHLAIPQDPAAGIVYAFDSNQFIRFNVDTLDSLAFPSRGVLVDASLEHSPGASDGRASLARSSVLGLAAYSVGEWAGHTSLAWSRAQRGAAALSLGGFLQLSGTQFESVQGRSVVLSRVVMARRIATLPATLGGHLRAGFSIEAGGAYDQDQPIKGSNFRQAGSVFMSVDTRFGPVYLAGGATRHGDKTVYLFLGPIW
jgi:NTE family protein